MTAGLTGSADPLLAAVQAGLRVFDLGRMLTIGMPQSPNHPPYWHALPRRHGDVVRPDGSSAANDVIIMGTHVGTHIDALAHVSQHGRLFGGEDAHQAARGGRFPVLGVHRVEPMICRGILLDIPAALGVTMCPAGYEIAADDLRQAVRRQGTAINCGDVTLIRSGWGQHFDADGTAYVGRESGVPGIGTEGAEWLAAQGIRAAGADTIAFERLAPGAGHSALPVHRVMLVERGIYLIETLALEELAAASVTEFVFILSPLPLYGATGSPVRPLAVVSRD